MLLLQKISFPVLLLSELVLQTSCVVLTHTGHLHWTIHLICLAMIHSFILNTDSYIHLGYCK